MLLYITINKTKKEKEMKTKEKDINKSTSSMQIGNS
jgi:hypothetical protein